MYNISSLSTLLWMTLHSHPHRHLICIIHYVPPAGIEILDVDYEDRLPAAPCKAFVVERLLLLLLRAFPKIAQAYEALAERKHRQQLNLSTQMPFNYSSRCHAPTHYCRYYF